MQLNHPLLIILLNKLSSSRNLSFLNFFVSLKRKLLLQDQIEPELHSNCLRQRLSKTKHPQFEAFVFYAFYQNSHICVGFRIIKDVSFKCLYAVNQ